MLTAGLLLLLCRAGWSAQPDVHLWKWQRTVTPASPAVEQCVVLDADLYAHAAPGLRDVRLVQQGHEVPYVLEESFDERAGSSPASDRTVYTTVQQIPLQMFHPIWPGPGEKETIAYRGEAIVAAHVPVERMQLEPTATSFSSARSTPVPFALSATPFTRGAEADGRTHEELVNDVLPGNTPVELTAIGANLQRDAKISVTVFSERFSVVLLQMRQRLLCFQPLSATPLQMIFGNERARPVRYDYSAHYHPLVSPVLGQLGPVEANPAYRDPVVRSPFWTRRYLVLLLCAVVFGGALFVALPRLLSRT